MKKVVYPDLIAEIARHGHSQKTIAKVIGTCASNISAKILGKRDWTISEIEKICNFYGKDYNELFKKEK